ncbi:MAG: hypothetical protein HQL87_03455 [Magnetococcales bacterium]|nr:hypothetical protein [Magnetococcales bacterium]
MGFTWQSFLLRLLMAFLIVFVVYNPTGYCYTRWVIESDSFNLLKLFVGMSLLIVLLIFSKAALQSLGKAGIVLAVTFFSLFFWMLIKYGLLTISNHLIQYLVLVIVSLVLAIGVSWSHIWHKLTGQVDVEEPQ